MGKIKRLKNNELVGGIDTNDIYPITSTEAVFSPKDPHEDGKNVSQEWLNNNIKNHRIVDNTIENSKLKDDTIDMGKLNTQLKTIIQKGYDSSWKVKEEPFSLETKYDANDVVYDEATNSSYVSLSADNLGNPVNPEDEGYVEGKWRMVINGISAVTATNEIEATKDQLIDYIQTDLTEAVATKISDADEDITAVLGRAEAAISNAEAAAQSISGMVDYVVADNPNYTDVIPVQNKTVTAQTGYYTCSGGSGASITVDDVNAAAYTPVKGGHVKVQMAQANTQTSGTVQLKFGATGTLYQIKYNGEPVSASNTWEAGEVISLYYDGTYYQASNAQGGGGKAEKIKYDNSQSGLAADNVQGAVDEVSKQGYVDIGTVGIGGNIQYYIDNNGIWGNNMTTHRIVEVKAGEHYRITANSEQSTVYRWLKSSTVDVDAAADVSDIDGVKHLIISNDSEIVHVPSDAHYMYLQGNITGGSSTIDYAPSEVMKLQYAPDAIQSVQEDVYESWYKKVIGTRTFSSSGKEGSIDNHELNLVAGKKYQLTINTSVTTIDTVGIKLYQTSSTSSNNITIGVVPSGISSYTINYSPDVDKNYQYLYIYNNSAEAIDMDVVIRVFDDVIEKINTIDSDIYLERPFEQGTIGSDGATLVDVNTLIRSTDFISIPKQVTIQAKDGYYIRRVFAYNPDGTLNALLNTDAVSSYTLHDPSLKYKFTVQKGANEDIDINPDEDCMVWTSVKKLVGGSDTQGVAALNAGIRRIFVAAADSTPAAKAIADYQCTGVNDELVIQEAINSLTYGGTVQLLDGQYNIDSFQTEITVNGVTEHIAIFVTAPDATKPRTVNLIGTTENKSYNSHYGVHIHVSQSAISNMNDTDLYTCIRGTGQKPISPYGDYTRITNMNFENFYLYIGDAEKKIRGISCAYFGSTHIKQVGVYTEHYFYYRFSHLKPSTPVEGSVGVIANAGSNDEMARIGWDTLNCGGMYIGVMTESIDGHSGVDHLIMQTCTFARCVYGMYFKLGTPKTMTIINSCDEGCTHLPYFGGSGHITAIDFNVERFNNAYYPDDPTSNTEFYAVEETPGSWIGTIEYTLQGWSGASAGNSGEHFWKNDGSGKGIRTRNLNYDHTGYSQPHCGEYLEQYFDTANNVWKTWNGSNWV